MRRSLLSVGLIRANSQPWSAGVAIISDIRVLQKTTLPAPIIAIFFDMPLFYIIFGAFQVLLVHRFVEAKDPVEGAD